MALRQRLLHDIAELQRDPYPNIVLCVQDDLQKACLVLTPSAKKPLHLTITFGGMYPLEPPQVTIESRIEHPNIYGDYICASILNTQEGYTPAYTLKGIAIQLLSFFSSERIEQEGGGRWIDLANYSHDSLYRRNGSQSDRYCEYRCAKCGFDGKIEDQHSAIVHRKALPDLPDRFAKHRLDIDQNKPANAHDPLTSWDSHSTVNVQALAKGQQSLIERILALPDEVILLILSQVDTRDLLSAAKVSSKIGEFMNSYDTVRMRELQCFCFKENFMETKLGVGVHVSRRGRQGTFESEFDLLSQQAFERFNVCRSVQGLFFEHWLPLPLSRRHWRSVSGDVNASLAQLAKAANIANSSCFNIEVIYNFMNNIVVKLSREAQENWDGPKSTLTHASEKAVESYFGVFHLLLCLATEQDQIVQDANRTVQGFLKGGTSKKNCPDLGQLLVAVLVSDQGLTQDLTFAIIKEAILRNVVWMLDNRGAGMAELSYLEPSVFSNYRLQRTFEASKVSYRLLMFLALFYRTARTPGKSISEICNDLFDRHGAPPTGTSAQMAAEIRKIRTVNTFPDFFKAMGLVETPSREVFCNFLKRTMEDSVKEGYSCQPITQAQALAIRMIREPNVEWAKDVVPSPRAPGKANLSFFPNKQGKGSGSKT